MIGGRAASEHVKEHFQVDAYARDGVEAVIKASDLVAAKRREQRAH